MNQEPTSLLHRLARQRPLLMSLLSGLLLAASFPPSPLAPLAYVGFVPLLLVVEAYHIRWFRYAYLSFLLWNLGGCYWLMLTAMGAHSPAEAIESLMAGLIANIVNPLLMSLPLWAYLRLRRRLGRWSTVWVFVPLWLLFEFLHFRWELTWSWLTLGHSQTYLPFYIQYIEFTGVLGISLHILVGNALTYTLLHQFGTGQNFHKTVYLFAGWLAWPLVLAPLLLWQGRGVYQSSGSVRVRVIQPNIDPYSKFEEMTRSEQIIRMRDLIRQPGIDSIDLVVMPETAIPKAFFADCVPTHPLTRPLIQEMQKDSFSLLTGLVELRFFPASIVANNSMERYDALRHNAALAGCPPHPDGWYDHCNATLMLRNDAPPASMQKSKLVPMVERVPYLETFDFLKNWNIDLGGSFGNYGLPDSIHCLATHTGAKVAPLVCYESQFGYLVREFVQNGADMLAIVTNDGWWGRSSGHIQHAHFASLRAIETRREIARSANTGISLFVDARGYLYNQTSWWTPAFADRKVTLHQGTTLYVLLGDWIGWLALLAAFALTGLRIKQRFFEKP